MIPVSYTHLSGVVVKFLSRIEPVRHKKVVEQDKKQRVEHIPGPCTGETGAEVKKRRIPVFRFIIKIACDKEKQRQVEQIDERTGEILSLIHIFLYDGDS